MLVLAAPSVATSQIVPVGRFPTVNVATPTPSPAAYAPIGHVKGPEIVHAVVARLQAQPMHVARRPAPVAVSTAPQEVVVHSSTRGAITVAAASICEAHPLQIDRVSGTIAPSGTVVVHGECFGPLRGTVKLLGAFADGALALNVSAWTEDTITASIPAVRGVLDQAVQLQLTRQNSSSAAALLHGPAQVSEPVALRFTATRETVSVDQRYVHNVSCPNAPGSDPRNNSNCQSLYGAGWDFDFRKQYAYHDATNGVTAGNVDTWQAQLPQGFVFDRVELQSNPDGDAVTLEPTLNAALVTWHIAWKSSHQRVNRVINDKPFIDEFEEGTHITTVYATGPAGWMHG